MLRGSFSALDERLTGWKDEHGWTLRRFGTLAFDLDQHGVIGPREFPCDNAYRAAAIDVSKAGRAELTLQDVPPVGQLPGRAYLYSATLPEPSFARIRISAYGCGVHRRELMSFS
jgi:hypothetical protein